MAQRAVADQVVEDQVFLKLRAAALAHRHREMAVLLFPPMPPPFLQRLLFPTLARLGRAPTTNDPQEGP
jgi:hypothetical protein